MLEKGYRIRDSDGKLQHQEGACLPTEQEKQRKRVQKKTRAGDENEILNFSGLHISCLQLREQLGKRRPRAWPPRVGNVTRAGDKGELGGGG